MEWPSKNVSQGGVLHPAKVKYSPETKDFLKRKFCIDNTSPLALIFFIPVLMEETKLTTMQRNKVNYILRNGEPLKSPKPTRRNFGEPDLPEVTIRPGSSKRRTIDTIIRSGAYEREKFVPEHPKVDREQAIKELQNVLAYGKKDVTPRTCRKPLKQKKNKQKTGEINRFDERKIFTMLRD